MRIPIRKIFAVSCVRPKSWIEMEPSWAWIKLEENKTLISTIEVLKKNCFMLQNTKWTHQFTFISLVFIFPSRGNLKEHTQNSMFLTLPSLYLVRHVLIRYLIIIRQVTDLMVVLFLSLFRVFRCLFSFTLNWMSLNSLLFDTSSTCTCNAEWF